MKIVCETIPHSEQRYPTVGDYWQDKNGVWQFRVSSCNNLDDEFPVLIHELVEWYLTQKRGISEQTITDFDIKFEFERERGQHSDEDEPGDDPRAPYVKEHRFAENIEHQIVHEVGRRWCDYELTLGKLYAK